MNKSKYRWLINPLFVLVTGTSCGNQVGNDSCPAGVDTDGDTLTDDVECFFGSDPTKADSDDDGVSDADEKAAGSNPNKADSDGDGVSDKDELSYPKICVAQDRNLQRRDMMTGLAPVCTASTDCQAGETCNGLDPTKTDSDGDSVPDAQEDPDLNGTIDFSKGDTDPRLWDTDGDTVSDKDSGAKICRPDGLANVTRVPLAGSGIQLGHDPIFGTAVIGSVVRGVVMVDDAASGVAGVTSSATTARADLSADRTAIEAQLQLALTTAPVSATVTPILVGRQFTTHEQYTATTSTFRIAKTGSNASALRDVVASSLAGGAATASKTIGADVMNSYYLDITVVRRGTGFNDIIATVSPATEYDKLDTQTAIRASDLVNSSGVAESNKTLDFACQGIKADKQAIADFLWPVDVSGSTGDNQQRLANTADKFFTRLASAGVDFRVGILAANGNPGTAVTLTAVQTPGWPNGFEFILGNDVAGPRTMCRQVTATTGGALGYCPADLNTTNDAINPYGPNGGGISEEPIAMGIRMNNLFKQNAGNANTNLKWRPGATKVIFGFTDEPDANDALGDANDWRLFFASQNNPDTGTRFAPTGTATGGLDATAMANVVKYYKDNNLLLFGEMPPLRGGRTCASYNVRDFSTCAVLAAGGAVIDAETANDNDIAAAMQKIVDAVAGAASQFKLTRTPITSTIKVNVMGVDVPRSRSNGFDYDAASKSVVFYGTQYRPQIGGQVYISYRVWAGSLG